MRGLKFFFIIIFISEMREKGLREGAYMVSRPCSTQGGGTPGTWDGYQGVTTSTNFVDSNFYKKIFLSFFLFILQQNA